MKVEELRNGSQERRVLSGMITDKTVLGRVVGQWDGKLFESRWANIVGGWCVDYHKRLSAAPGRAVESLFDDWSNTQPDDATVKLVDRFLAEMSADYDRNGDALNSEYLIDLAGKHFNAVREARLAESIQTHLASGKNSEQLINDYRRVELGVGSAIDVLEDKAALYAAFDADTNRPLVPYRDDLGTFFGRTFCREGFVSFMAPEKVGKSYWLLDVAYTAVKDRKKVAFFEVGDLGREEMIKRIAVRVTGTPELSPNGKWPCEVRKPTAIRRPKKEDPIAPVEYEDLTFKRAITADETWEAYEEFKRGFIKSKRVFWKMSNHPNFTIDVPGIRSIIDGWIQNNWIPDVVIIDYADILALPKGKDRRDQINDNWMQLRRMSQELHCLVVTATQTNRESYDKTIADRRHVSEDKRKLAHVTAMVSINTSGKEKDAQIFRLNYAVRRKGHYSPGRSVFCASCLALSQPAVVAAI